MFKQKNPGLLKSIYMTRVISKSTHQKRPKTAILRDRDAAIDRPFIQRGCKQGRNCRRTPITARRNRLLGLWAAERMGLSGDAATAYAKEVVDAEFHGGDRHVVEKVCADLAAKGPGCTPAQVQFELEHLAERAKEQIMKE